MKLRIREAQNNSPILNQLPRVEIDNCPGEHRLLARTRTPSTVNEVRRLIGDAIKRAKFGWPLGRGWQRRRVRDRFQRAVTARRATLLEVAVRNRIKGIRLQGRTG